MSDLFNKCSGKLVLNHLDTYSDYLISQYGDNDGNAVRYWPAYSWRGVLDPVAYWATTSRPSYDYSCSEIAAFDA